MAPPRAFVAMAALLVAAGVAALVACDDNEPVKEHASARDPGRHAAGALDGAAPGHDVGPGNCVTNPRTHEEIINGCTDAVQITKTPTLPLLLADGGLPPRP